MAKLSETLVRRALAAFISAAADATDTPHSYSIRGDCANSLCLLLMLTTEEYAAVLKIANLVEINRAKNGGYIFKTSERHWNQTFLQAAGLWSFDGMGIAESTKAKIKVKTLKNLTQPTRIQIIRRRLISILCALEDVQRASQ